MLFSANKTEVNNFWLIVMVKSAYRYFWQVWGFASRQGTKKYKEEWRKEEEKQGEKEQEELLTFSDTHPAKAIY